MTDLGVNKVADQNLPGSRRFIAPWLFDFLCYLIFGSLALLICLPYISNRTPAGWDLSPHYYLAERMLHYMQQGRISGYNPEWLAGYPEFTLYPPFYFILATLPVVLSDGEIPVALSFNVLNVILILSLPLAFRYLTLSWMGKHDGRWGMLFGFAFLFLPKNLSMLGVGLGGIFATGLAPGFLGFVLCILFIACLVRLHRENDFVRAVLAAMLLAATIVSHLLSAVFIIWVLLIYVLVHPRRALHIVPVPLLLAAALSAWWWRPFLQHMPYSAGQTIGTVHPYFDPLHAVFPGLDPGSLQWWLSSSHISTWLTIGSFSLAVPGSIMRAPWLGLLLLLCVSAGLFKAAQVRNRFLLLLALLTAIFLPRSFFSTDGHSGLHFYRFTQHLWIMVVPLASSGMQYFLDSRHRSPPLTFIIRSLMLMLLVVSLGISAYQAFFIFVPEYSSDDARRFSAEMMEGRFFPENHPGYEDARDVALYLKAQNPSGRVAVETTRDNYFKLGSPHFFSAFLPQYFGLRVVPGLLVESSISSPYINRFLSRNSEHIVWGRLLPFSYSDEKRFPFKKLLHVAEHYGLEYLLISSAQLLDYVEEMDDQRLSLVYKNANFAVARFNKFRGLVGAPGGARIFYDHAGGPSCDDFSWAYYLREELKDFSIICSRRRYSELSSDEKSYFDGIIVSNGPSRAVPAPALNYYSGLGRPVLFINAFEAGAGGSSNDSLKDNDKSKNVVQFLADFSKLEGAFDWFGLVHSEKDKIPMQMLPHTASDRTLSFSGQGLVTLRYSFAPGWKFAPDSRRRRQLTNEVFRLMPSLMALISDGDTLLFYD